MRGHFRYLAIAGFYLLLVASLGAGCSSAPVDTPVADTVQAPQAPQLPPAASFLALTPTEFNNTVRDLLGMPSDGSEWPEPPAVAAQILPPKGSKTGVFFSQLIDQGPWPWAFPKEPGVEGFEGMEDGQLPSPYSVEEIQKASVHYATYVLVSPTFFTCEGFDGLEATAQKTCALESLLAFTEKAWRRPLTEAETTRLTDFFENQWSEGSPEEAVVLTAAGILQSPAFVFRVEQGDPTRAEGEALPLTHWEIASRLSYFIWDSMPDETLFKAARNGELGTADEVRAQAKRMLQDPKARTAVVHFHHQWLGTDRVHTISPARRAYGPLFGVTPQPPLDTTGDGDWPTVLLPIRHSMDAETHLFIERTLFDGAGTLRALLTDNHGYMSDKTESIYGDEAVVLNGPAVKWSFGRVVNSIGQSAQLILYPTEFPAHERAGVLTLPSVLGIGAYAVHPAPIMRGKMILERITCQAFGAPPPGAEGAVPPDALEVESTNRKRTENATSADACAPCHNVLNPPGFAFENYDAMGAYRTEDNGQPVDASGAFTLYSGESFDFQDGVDLAHQLAESPQVHDCYALWWLRYATGISFHLGDEGLEEIQSEFRDHSRLKDLLISIAGSDMFRFRRQGGSE